MPLESECRHSLNEKKPLTRPIESVSHADVMRRSGRFFSHPSIPEPVNIQPRDGKCKPYQLKQVRDIIKEHGL
jgi:hypothetical protein